MFQPVPVPTLIIRSVAALVLLLMAACGNSARTDVATTAVPTPATSASATAAVLPTPSSAAEARVAPSATPETVVVQRVQRATSEPGILAARATPVNVAGKLPLLTAHMEQVRAAMAQPIPVLPLTEGLDAQQIMAQQLVLGDPRFVAETRDPQSGVPLRNEIFGIYPIRPSDITEETALCATTACYRVELYNYAYNLSTIAVVNLIEKRVLTVSRLLETQPDIPPHLTAVAQ
ncbi:MAG: hypothetical protein KDE53_22120, partial [Caldilineaceae bacterium]|nr:hypothetical protein [Caldilineaceae bacterium]